MTTWKPCNWFLKQACFVAFLTVIALTVGFALTDTFNAYQSDILARKAVKERMENTLSGMTLRLNEKDVKIEALLTANMSIRLAYETCLAETP